MVGDVDGGKSQVRAEFDVVGGCEAFGDDGEGGHVAEGGEGGDGEVEGVAAVASG